MSNDNCDKSVYLSTLQAKHGECLAKASYLEKLVDGAEQVTFSNIERGREVLLQINQANDVLHRMMFQSTKFQLKDEDLTLMDKFSHETTKAVTEATINWEIILLWIPAKETKKDNLKSKDVE